MSNDNSDNSVDSYLNKLKNTNSILNKMEERLSRYCEERSHYSVSRARTLTPVDKSEELRKKLLKHCREETPVMDKESIDDLPKFTNKALINSIPSKKSATIESRSYEKSSKNYEREQIEYNPTNRMISAYTTNKDLTINEIKDSQVKNIEREFTIKVDRLQNQISEHLKAFQKFKTKERTKKEKLKTTVLELASALEKEVGKRRNLESRVKQLEGVLKKLPSQKSTCDSFEIEPKKKSRTPKPTRDNEISETFSQKIRNVKSQMKSSLKNSNRKKGKENQPTRQSSSFREKKPRLHLM